MKSMPDAVAAYKRTPIFTETTIPAGLLKAHQTKAGVWGSIVVLSGKLEYTILEPSMEVQLLTADYPGVVEPTVLHQVAPQGEVAFYVEFYR